MKASEIVEKFKSVLLSSEDAAEVNTEEVAELEVNEPTELAYEDKEGMEDEMPSEEVAEEVAEEAVKYATKEELEAAVAEMKAMYEAIMDKMGSEEMETEVPTEELAKEELSAQEPAAQPLTHSPEVESSPAPQFFSGIKPRNTMSVVYEKMFNK